MSSSLIDLALLDHSSLIARSHICLVRADSAAWVRSQVFNLANMATYLAGSSVFEIIQYDSRYVFMSLFGAASCSFGHGGLDKGVLLDEEAAASLRGGKRLTQLSIAALVCRHLVLSLLNSSATASLPADAIGTDDVGWLRRETHFVDLVNGANAVGRCRWLGALR